MKTNPIKFKCLLFTCLIGCALFNSTQAAQPSVTVQSYAKHVGSNTVYTYRVTNHGPDRMFDFTIGCNCSRENKTYDEPQLFIYPVDYDFSYGDFGRTSKSGYLVPAGWKGFVSQHDGISYISFEFGSIWGSGISLLPGYTETFSIITPTIDNRASFIYYRGSPEGAAFWYEKNRRGYLTGHYSYREDDAAGKSRVVSYPMELIDQAPPTLSVTLSPATLWPPNNKLVSVNAVITAQDDYDPEPEIKLVSITASEILSAGEIQDAVIGTDDRSFSLAAMRNGDNMAGRIYTVTYSATDASGNQTTATAIVTVPHDQGK